MSRSRFSPLLFLLILAVAGCTSKTNSDMQQTDASGTGQTFTLTNASGLKVMITPQGGHIMSIQVPGRDGSLTDVVLGYDSVKEYEGGRGYYGSTIGRYGNRIKTAMFRIDSNEYHLQQNNGLNSLHGGPGGFHTRLWKGQEITTSEGKAIELTYLSPDMEEGFPGNLNAKVIFSLTDSNELKIQYEATTDKPTHVNLTNHSYFNLSGEGTGDILNHEMMINADKFIPVDTTLIPTGELRAVKGTPFDFLAPHKIGERINADEEQVKRGKGYDHCFVLNKKTPDEMSLAARVSDPASGRTMEVWTTEPGIQFYTGNFLTGAPGKGGKPYNYRYAFCLETQHFPDSPNRPEFPTTLLKPGEVYKSTTVYKFISK